MSLCGSVVGVAIQDFSFSPAAMTVMVGTTVKWTNNGPSAHTTTSNTGTWDSGQLSSPTSGGGYGGGSAGGTYQHTFMGGGPPAPPFSHQPPPPSPGVPRAATAPPPAEAAPHHLLPAQGGAR